MLMSSRVLQLFIVFAAVYVGYLAYSHQRTESAEDFLKVQDNIRWQLERDLEAAGPTLKKFREAVKVQKFLDLRQYLGNSTYQAVSSSISLMLVSAIASRLFNPALT